MRIFFKIIFFPITLILSILVSVLRFVSELSGWLLNILSGLFFLLAVVCKMFSFFSPIVDFSWTDFLICMGFAFILSPYGLTGVLDWIINRIDNVNGLIKGI